MKSPADDTHEDRLFRAEADADRNGLRARLERKDSMARPEELLTPELALVDPDLARRARERLPEPRAEAPTAPIADAVGVSHTPPAIGRAAEPRRPRRKRRLVGWMLAATLLGAAVGVVFSDTKPLRRAVSDHAPSSLGPIKDLTSPSESPPSPASETPTAGAPEADRHPTGTATTGTVSAESREAAPKPQPIAPRPAAPSGRNFAWVPIPGAASYLVQFYRGRTEIFRAKPSAPHLVLPARWSFRGRRYRLAPGRYRWSVRPLIRGRRGYGPPIVRAKLVI